MIGILVTVAMLLGAVTGRVVDESSKPAAGAAVHLVRWTSETLPGNAYGIGSVVELRAAVADAEGQFRFDLDEGQVVGVWADQGEAWASLPVAPLLAGDVVELRLVPTVLLRGRIVTTAPGGAGGKVPAPGAELKGGVVPVRSREPGKTPDPHTRRRFWFTARTGSDGSFALRAYVRSEDQAQGLGFGVRLGALYEWVKCGDPAAPLEVVLCPGERVRRWHARLVDQTGAPVAGAVVCRPYESWIRGTSDATGRIEFEYEGTPEIVVFPRRHQWEWLPPGAFAPADQAEFPTIQLDPGKVLSVRLLRPDRSVLAHVRVAVVGTVPGKRALDAVETTDRDGRLELGLPSGGASALVEVGGSWVPLFDTKGSRPLPQGDVVLDPSARLTGQVLDHKGTPIAQARVQILPEEMSDDGWLSFQAAARSVPVDKNGRFLAAGLLDGTVQVAVDAPGLLPWFGTCTAGKEVRGVTVTLRAGVTLAGRTLTAKGEPIAGVQVVVTVPDEDGNRRKFGLTTMDAWAGPVPTVNAVSDDRGRFEIGGLPEDVDLSLSATATNGAQILSVRLAPIRAQRDLELRLQETAVPRRKR